MPESLRWGIIGLGKISGDFVTALHSAQHPHTVQKIFKLNFKNYKFR